MPKYVVRYGIMRSLGILSVKGRDQRYSRGQRVVARTRRGLEVGEVLCEATKEAVPDPGQYEQGEILRALSGDDANELSHMENQAGQEFRTCQRYVRELGLEMELVDLEHIFGGERIVVYYLAENRVDFRELVRQLAREFQTRIEMRQIGVRDEAKLLADYGDCGKPVCCNTHLSAMPPVSMKMAKLQKATLDPTKISGRCGRLKCCLRYEYDTYLELKKELPAIGSEIVTNLGKATVLGQEILTSQLLVETEDHRRTLIDVADVLTVIRHGRGRRIASEDGDDPEENADRSRPQRSHGSRPARWEKPAPTPQPQAETGDGSSPQADSADNSGNSGNRAKRRRRQSPRRRPTDNPSEDRPDRNAPPSEPSA